MADSLSAIINALSGIGYCPQLDVPIWQIRDRSMQRARPTDADDRSLINPNLLPQNKCQENKCQFVTNILFFLLNDVPIHSWPGQAKPIWDPDHPRSFSVPDGNLLYKSRTTLPCIERSTSTINGKKLCKFSECHQTLPTMQSSTAHQA